MFLRIWKRLQFEHCSIRKVVDSNFLNDERFRKYLSESTNNYAVVTDYAAMEAYKGSTLKSIFPSMQILAEHPKQVIVLKGTQDVCGLKGRRAGLQRRMIDEEQTREFSNFCRHLVSAKNGDIQIRDQLLDNGRAATAHMDQMLAGAAALIDGIEQVSKTYTDTELKIIRNGSKFTPEMEKKKLKDILWLAAFLFQDHPRVPKLPAAKELPYTYIFRAALCAYVMIIRWISVGGAKTTKSERVRNDIVDVFFAAYATYFDGLLSADEKLVAVYREADVLLQTVFLVDTK